MSNLPKPKTTMYKFDYELRRAVSVTADNPSWPNYDDDGKQIFENTHFLAEKDAWESGWRNSCAGVSLAGHSVNSARQALRDAERQAADAAVEFGDVKHNYEQWQQGGK